METEALSLLVRKKLENIRIDPETTLGTKLMLSAILAEYGRWLKMGFTHYWIRNVIEFDKVRWKKFIADIEKVRIDMPDYFEGDGGEYTKFPIEICGGDGKGKPTFDMKEVWFNGKDCKEDLAHETFHISRIYSFKDCEWKKEDWKNKKEIFNFCKTARKPYSFLVEVVLLLANYHFDGQIKISSDGDEEDWKFAKDYFGKMFPKYAIVLRLNGGD